MKGSSHLTAVGTVAATVADDVTAPTPPLLTVAELSARWGIAGYTLRAWARAGRITDSRYEHGEWRFLHTARLRLTPRGAVEGPSAAPILLDLAAYPVTAAELASHARCTEDTIRRRARAGQYTPAIYTPVGWRFGAQLLAPSFPAFKAASGPSGAPETADSDREADPLAALRNLTFDVRRLGVPAATGGPYVPAAAGAAAPRRNRRGARTIYRR